MNFKGKFWEIIKTKTIAQSGVTFIGTAINGVLGILFFLVLARNLGPENFGLLSVAITTLTLVGDIADLGINTGLINFVSRYSHKDSSIAFRFMKLGLEIKILVWLVVLIFGWFFAPFLATNIFLKPQLSFSLQLAFLGVGGALLFSFVANSLQSWQRFWSWSFLNIFANGLRLFTVLLLIYLFNLNQISALVTYISVPFLGFMIGLILLPNKFLTVSGECAVFDELFGYSKQVALFILIAAFSSRLDIFLSTRFLSISEVGIYSVATQLTSFMPQVVFALAAVVAPKLANFGTDNEAWKYLKKVQLLVLGLAGGGLILLPLIILLIPYLYGNVYEASIIPFIILFLSQIVFLLSLPAHQSIFYYFSKPGFFVWISLIHLLIVGVSGLILIPTYGPLGAAFSILLGNLFDLLLPLIWVLNKFKERKVALL